jgi:hypothetical protein
MLLRSLSRSQDSAASWKPRKYQSKREQKHAAKKEKNRAEAFFLERFSSEITFQDYKFLEATPRTVYRSLSLLQVRSMVGTDPIATLFSFDHHFRTDTVAAPERLYARAVSTYPFNAQKNQRFVDPRCMCVQANVHSVSVCECVRSVCTAGVSGVSGVYSLFRFRACACVCERESVRLFHHLFRSCLCDLSPSSATTCM